MKELDDDDGGSIDKEEFSKIIFMVFDKMMENEVELIQALRVRDIDKEATMKLVKAEDD